MSALGPPQMYLDAVAHERRNRRTIAALRKARVDHVGHDPAATYARIVTACCPESPLDIDAHARLVVDAVASHRNQQAAGRTSLDGTRAAGGTGGPS